MYWLNERLLELEAEINALIKTREDDSDNYDYEKYEELIKEWNSIQRTLSTSQASIDKNYSPYWSVVSRLIRDEHYWFCNKCGINLSSNRDLLHLHHKDRNRINNDDANLEPLCIICHATCLGHSHLIDEITDEMKCVIYKKRALLSVESKKHLPYLKMTCSHKLKHADNELREIIINYGCWMHALYSNKIHPFTKAQARFVDVCNKKKNPKSSFERAWHYYMLENDL